MLLRTSSAPAIDRIRCNSCAATIYSADQRAYSFIPTRAHFLHVNVYVMLQVIVYPLTSVQDRVDGTQVVANAGIDFICIKPRVLCKKPAVCRAYN